MRKTLFSLFFSALFIQTGLSALQCYPDYSFDREAHFFAEFLYLKGQGEGIALFIEQEADIFFPYEVDPSWSCGARAGFEQQINADKLSFFGQFTFYDTKTEETRALSLPEAEEKYKNFSSFYFQYNCLDFGIARACSFCFESALKPFAGFTFAYIRENLYLENQFSPLLKERTKEITSFQGCGVNLGLSFNLPLWYCASIFGAADITGLYGSHYVKKDEENTSFYFNAKRARLITNMKIGIQQQAHLCNRYFFYSQIGWEYITFFDQTNFRAASSKMVENFVLQGFFFTTGLHF